MLKAAAVPIATILVPQRVWTDTPARIFAFVEFIVTGIALIDVRLVSAERLALVP